jgi:alkanesulfonate monooxygenase SsuD/methylene tetrahydromethanopterin reductase-like flavin-dependent oxidoreductase (luciferase family)
VRYGVSLPNFGIGLDARRVAGWAASAEAAGWDGFFLWDHLFAFAPGPIDAVDPWIALTAAACATATIRLGTLVTPLPRRRPVVVARQTATLDVLSGGRLVLGVGIGAFPYEWEYCGEEPDQRVRAAMLDEHLAVLARLWTGEPVTHRGTHYRLDGPDFAAVCYPPPLQRPRVPVWVGGTWPGHGPFRRAARWDGVFPMRADGPWQIAAGTPHSAYGARNAQAQVSRRPGRRRWSRRSSSPACHRPGAPTPSVRGDALAAAWHVS